MSFLTKISILSVFILTGFTDKHGSIDKDFTIGIKGKRISYISSPYHKLTVGQKSTVLSNKSGQLIHTRKLNKSIFRWESLDGTYLSITQHKNSIYIENANESLSLDSFVLIDSIPVTLDTTTFLNLTIAGVEGANKGFHDNFTFLIKDKDEEITISLYRDYTGDAYKHARVESISKNLIYSAGYFIYYHWTYFYWVKIDDLEPKNFIPVTESDVLKTIGYEIAFFWSGTKKYHLNLINKTFMRFCDSTVTMAEVKPNYKLTKESQQKVNSSIELNSWYYTDSVNNVKVRFMPVD